LYALLNGGQKYAWSSSAILLLIAIAVVFIILFIFVESKAKEPMLPLSLFKIPVITLSNIIGFFVSCVLIGATVYLPMWIQLILGHSATSSGLTLMPMMIAWPLGATFAGRYMYKIGSKKTAMLGSTLITLGSAWLLALSLGSPYWYFVGIMIVIGLGMGYAMTPTTVLVQSAVGWNLRGAATASNTFMRSLGQSIGIAILGTLFNNSLASRTQGVFHENLNNMLSPEAASLIPANVLEMIHEALAQGLHHVFLVVFAFSVLTLLATIFFPPHRKVMVQQQQQVS
jgi:MFS family permease